MSGNAGHPSGLDILGVDEFIAECRAEVEENEGRAAKKQKIKDSSPGLLPRAEPRNQPSASGNNSRFALELQALAEKHGISVTYHFEEPQSEHFLVMLKLVKPNANFVNFSTKDQRHSQLTAKEDVAVQGLQFLLKDLGLTQPAPSASSTPTLGKVDMSQNWLTMLNNHCQTRGIVRPVYNDFRVDSQLHGAICSLPSIPRRQFGSKETVYFTSKHARQMAAKCVVMHFQSQGHRFLELVKASPVSEKAPSTVPKEKPQASAAKTSGPMSQLDNGQKASSNGKSNTKSPAASTRVPKRPQLLPDDTNLLTKATPATTRLIGVCAGLGIKPPNYTWTRDSKVPEFITGGAVFSGADLAKLEELVPVEPVANIYGVVGEVVNCYGIQKAREECAGRVVAVLTRLIENQISVTKEALRAGEKTN